MVVPRSWDEPDESEAYMRRAGKAVARLRDTLGDAWPLRRRPKDMTELRFMRDDILEALGAGRGAVPRPARQAAHGGSSTEVAEDGGGTESGSGAAQLSASQQPGSVSMEVAYRLHGAAAQLRFEEGGDVGAGLAAAPEHVRDDLARALASNMRVDAAGERSANRNSLPAVVRRMCAALVASVQDALIEVVERDQSATQYLAPEAARTHALAAVTGKLSLPEYITRARTVLGSQAPAKGSISELKAAWRLMKVAFLAVGRPLFGIDPMDASVMKIDDMLDTDSVGVRLEAPVLTEWLTRVMDHWEMQCLRFRQIKGPRPSLRAAIQKFEQFVGLREAAAALLQASSSQQQKSSQYKGETRSTRSGKRQYDEGATTKTERTGRGRNGGGEDGEAGKEQTTGKRPKGAQQQGGGGQTRQTDNQKSAWPGKPRMADDVFSAYKEEMKAANSNICMHFVVGTCRREGCKFQHEVPTNFESIKAKFAAKQA